MQDHPADRHNRKQTMTDRKQLLIFFFFCYSLLHSCVCHARPELTDGMFVFGSSLVDNGNNNYLDDPDAPNYMPYGIDFPLGNTGRYNNGKNVIDVLGQLLHLPSYIPVFLDPSTHGPKILHGVNFASGGSGVLDDTGAAHVITLNQQIINFEKVTLPDLKAQLGYDVSLSNYLFIVGSVGNDLGAFLQQGSETKVSLEDFVANLIQTFTKQIEKLHSLGARKLVLVSVYPIGCIPFSVTNEGCVELMNQAAQIVNLQLKTMVDVLQRRMPGSQLVYLSSYNIMMDILVNPTPKGFKDTTNSCCEMPSQNVGIMCRRGGSVCSHRREYVFFDDLHMTEAVNEIIAIRGFNSSLKDVVYPINIKHLAGLQLNLNMNSLHSSVVNKLDEAQ